MLCTSILHYFLQCLLQVHLAMMENFSWPILPTPTLMGATSMEAELRCASMESSTQCVTGSGQTTMLQFSATTWAIATNITVSFLLFAALLHFLKLFPKTGAEATGGMTFGLSDVTPLGENVTCIGTEYDYADCPGSGLINDTSDYCLSGRYQAGVRCIQGRAIE